jgi:hypothetical protein
MINRSGALDDLHRDSCAYQLIKLTVNTQSSISASSIDKLLLSPILHLQCRFCASAFADSEERMGRGLIPSRSGERAQVRPAPANAGTGRFVKRSARHWLEPADRGKNAACRFVFLNRNAA